MANLFNLVQIAVFVSFLVFLANAMPMSGEFVDDFVSDQAVMAGDVQVADNWIDFDGYPTGR